MPDVQQGVAVSRSAGGADALAGRKNGVCAVGAYRRAGGAVASLPGYGVLHDLQISMLNVILTYAST